MFKKKSQKTDTLLQNIPRGVSSRYLSEQTPPQSRWLNSSEILAEESLKYDPLNPGGKILYGAVEGQLTGIEDNRHVMTVAGSRAGKTVIVISNIFFYPGSVICIDPKGEMALITAEHRAKVLGQKIYILDPFKIVRGEEAQFRASYNPLHILTVDNPTIVEDALIIIDALIVSSGKESDPHWNESAGHFILGVTLYVCVGNDIENEDRHLGTVRKLINNVLKVIEGEKIYALPERIFDAMEILAKEGHAELAEVIEGSIRGFFDKGDEERGSVLSTVRRHTQFLDFFSMKEVLSGHDFDLADLKRLKQGVSIYLVLPATRLSSCNRWLRLFINNLLSAMESEKSVPKYPVLVCLDEFPLLGYMKQLLDAAAQIASFHVKLWFIIQDWSQGKSLYGDRFESLAANAGVTQAFGNVDLSTTEYLSKRLGKTIVEERRQSEINAEQREKGLSGSTESQQSYPLMTADEISRYFSRNDPLKRQLLLVAGHHPMVLQRVEWFNPESPIYKYIPPLN